MKKPPYYHEDLGRVVTENEDGTLTPEPFKGLTRSDGKSGRAPKEEKPTSVPYGSGTHVGKGKTKAGG